MESGMKKELHENMLWWDEAAVLHAESGYYDVAGFLTGKSTLHDLEKELLGDVRGKSLLHLQCHFGLDTLSLARLGAAATGVDFSEEAIRIARSLNDRLGLGARFVRSNVYDLKENLTGQFDIVYTSYGVLCWLHDLKGWAEVIAHFLKDGGRFVLIDGHPLGDMFAEEDGQLRLASPYFYREEPDVVVGDGTYAVPDAVMTHKKKNEWAHSISEIMQSLWGAGLQITSFSEYPYGFYEKFPGLMKRDDAGRWVFKDEGAKPPLMFSLTARK